MIEITMGMALLKLTSQPSGVDYPEKKIIWPESNTGEAPTWEEVEVKRQELINAEPMRVLRVKRNNKLAETDWTQNRDITLSNDSDWQTYRQSLRDLPQNFSPIIDIITEDGYPIVKEQTDWPEKPS